MSGLVFTRAGRNTNDTLVFILCREFMPCYCRTYDHVFCKNDRFYKHTAHIMEHRVHLHLPPLPAFAHTPCIVPSSSFLPEHAANLNDFIQSRCPAVTPDEQQLQTRALQRLQALFKAWAAGRPFCMFVAGSFRLGVHTRTADIDVLFVTTRAITHADVFTQFVTVLQNAPEVTQLQPVARARVPLIGLTLFDQEFDVLTCHLRTDVLPSRDALLNSYEWMNGLADADVLAFNGPRVTEMIPRAIQQPHAVFVRALRFLRHWAKQRFVYSNKAGYLGGVNLALMLCFVAQRADASASALELIFRFFDTFATWDTKQPVVLDAHVPHVCPAWLAHLEWRPQTAASSAFIVLTPCFPRFNTTYTTSQFSFRVMQREFARGARILRTADTNSMSSFCSARLAALCCPLEPVRTCTRFLNVRVTAPATGAGRVWLGYIEAQMRHLVEYLSREQLAVAEFRYLPVWCAGPVDDATAYACRQTFITADDDGKIRPFVVTGTLNVPLTYFIETHAAAGPPRPVDSTITIAYCSRTELPPDLFRVLYDELLTPDVLAQLEPTATMPSTSATSTPSRSKQLVTRSSAKALREKRLACLADIRKHVMDSARARRNALRARPRWPLDMLRINTNVPCGIVVRPFIVHRQHMVSFDVYVGPEIIVGGCHFKASAWTPPLHARAPDAYVLYLRQTFTRDALASIANKRIACWCAGVRCACHAQLLLTTACSAWQALKC